jgi:hypothetical protein
MQRNSAKRSLNNFTMPPTLATRMPRLHSRFRYHQPVCVNQLCDCDNEAKKVTAASTAV